MVAVYYVAQHCPEIYAVQAGSTCAISSCAPRSNRPRRRRTRKPKQRQKPTKRPPTAAKAQAGGAAITRLPPAVVLTSLANLTGTWKGQGALTGHGLCDLRLELRETHEAPGHYTGYSALSCLNIAPLMTPRARNRASGMQNRLNPAASILTGVPEDGSIRFHVDKTINADINGCAATSFTATPFGTNRISVQWQEGSCQGGQIILGKNGR